MKTLIWDEKHRCERSVPLCLSAKPAMTRASVHLFTLQQSTLSHTPSCRSVWAIQPPSHPSISQSFVHPCLPLDLSITPQSLCQLHSPISCIELLPPTHSFISSPICSPPHHPLPYPSSHPEPDTVLQALCLVAWGHRDE